MYVSFWFKFWLAIILFVSSFVITSYSAFVVNKKITKKKMYICLAISVILLIAGGICLYATFSDNQKEEATTDMSSSILSLKINDDTLSKLYTNNTYRLELTIKSTYEWSLDDLMLISTDTSVATASFSKKIDEQTAELQIIAIGAGYTYIYAQTHDESITSNALKFVISEPDTTSEPGTNEKDETTALSEAKKNTSEQEYKYDPTTSIKSTVRRNIDSNDACDVVYTDYDNKAMITIKYSYIGWSVESRTRAMMLDVYTILKELSNQKDIGIEFYIYYPESDIYGNETDTKVLEAYYSKETRDKINWENASVFLNMDEIADTFNTYRGIEEYIP